MEFDLGEILKISFTAMRINRCHPDIPRDLKWGIQILIGYLIYFIPCVAIFYNIFWINLNQNDYSEASRNSIFFVSCLPVTMKYFIMFRYRNIILSLFEDMKTDLEVAKNLPIDEQVAIRDNAVKERNVCKQWLFLGVSSCGTFNCKMILDNLYNYIIGEDKLVNEYDLVCPKAIEERKDDIYMFLILYFFLFYYGVFSAVMHVAFVPLGPVFMLHASAQLVLVRKRVESLYLNDVDEAEINDKLKDIIQHLQRIYDFVGRVSTCLTVFYEVIMKVTSIVLPITLFELIKSFKSGSPSFEFTMFLFIALISSSQPCIYGDFLLEKGEEVRQAVYACGWERKYDRSTRSTLLLLLQQSSQPIVIRTVFRTACLDALADVFKQAYTIFNLINTVWE